MAWVVALAVLVDAASTVLGLSLGLGEAGPLASWLLPLIGPLYWPIEAAVLYGLYRLLEARGPPRPRRTPGSPAGATRGSWPGSLSIPPHNRRGGGCE